MEKANCRNIQPSLWCGRVSNRHRNGGGKNDPRRKSKESNKMGIIAFPDTACCTADGGQDGVGDGAAVAAGDCGSERWRGRAGCRAGYGGCRL